MTEIILSTLNARYWHSSFGLRYLLANMGDLRSRAEILEFVIGDRTIDVLSSILEHSPKIVGLGVYIWNVDATAQLVADLKRVSPDTVVVLGGPEVSYELENQHVVNYADFLITGEADLAFPELCRNLLSNPQRVTKTSPEVPVRGPQVIHAEVPDVSSIALPYRLYSEEDIAHRVIYVEVSRGCPFTCEFCLSALDIPVRLFNLDEFLSAMQHLLDRGAKQFKFVDRTFNLNLRVSTAVLQFFLERYEPGMFLHFEMIPDRLPDALRQLISQFPAGALQFEIGVQTFNPDVGNLISRKQDNEKLADNFHYLRNHSGVHIHADLIVGLPGESVESFASGFNRLVALRPHEIQVGILKRLKGTPITRHDKEWQMVYSKHPPFEILSNRLIDFETMHRLRRFARYWDLIANSGNFLESLELIWGEGSAFHSFWKLCDWLFDVERRTHKIPLKTLLERLFEFLTQHRHVDEELAGQSLLRDYARGGRRDIPAHLRRFHQPDSVTKSPDQILPRRQARHKASAEN